MDEKAIWQANVKRAKHDYMILGFVLGFLVSMFHYSSEARSTGSKLRDTRIKSTEIRSQSLPRTGLNHIEKYQIRSLK